MRRRAARLAAAGGALLLLGCTPVQPSPTPGGPVSRASSAPSGAATTTTAVAELQAGLAALLLQRAHLLALAQEGAVAAGPLDLITAQLVDVAGAPPALAGALQREQAAVLTGGPVDTREVVAALRPAAPGLEAGALEDALADLDRRSRDGQGALLPPDATRAAALLAPALRQRGAPDRSPGAALRARVTAQLVHRTALVAGTPERAAADAALAATLVRRPGPERARVAAALVAESGAAPGAAAAAERALAAAVAAAVPTLSTGALVADLASGRAARQALAGAAPTGRALALGAAAQGVLGAAATLAAAVAEHERLV